MRISSFGQNQPLQTASFQLSQKAEEESSPSIESKKTEGKTEAERTFYKMDNLEFQIEKNINESSRFLHDGLVKIFDRGASLLAGRTSAEYDEHIKNLTEAIEGQDYKNAEKLIDKFFNGDTEKVLNRVKSLAEQAEKKFWHGMDDAIGYLKSMNSEYDLEIDDQKYENITAFEIAKIAISRVRESKENFSEQDFESILNPLRDRAVNHAKSKLGNAGQNKYDEDADSVTQAAAEFSRNKIFDTDDVNIKEDDEELADIYALTEGDEVTQEQVDRLRQRNKRKSDSFSLYMRESSDEFIDEFSKLMYAAVEVKENDMPNEPGVRFEEDPMNPLGKLLDPSKVNIPTPNYPVVDYSVETLITGSEAAEKYKAMQIQWEEYLAGSDKEDK